MRIMARRKPTTGQIWSGSDDLRSMLVPTGQLSHDPNNVRRHGERNRLAIRASLEAFGQLKPIVADKDGVVRAGNGTLAAAREMGWTHLAVTRSSLGPAELIAFGISDNRTAELAEWDAEELAETLKELQGEGFDIQATGYDSTELDRLLDSLKPDEPDDDKDDGGSDSDGDGVASPKVTCPDCGCRFAP